MTTRPSFRPKTRTSEEPLALRFAGDGIPATLRPPGRVEAGAVTAGGASVVVASAGGPGCDGVVLFTTKPSVVFTVLMTCVDGERSAPGEPAGAEMTLRVAESAGKLVPRGRNSIM